MGIDTTHRIEAGEMMDDFSLAGEELRDALDKIAAINRLLGGNRLTLQGVKSLLVSTPGKRITIVDVGCGNGDMLRVLADFAKNHRLYFELIGIDANPFTVTHARNLSEKYSNISYECVDVFSKSFKEMSCDIILCTLTLHHFKNNEIVGLVDRFTKRSRLGVVINDLHRSWLAYRLFQLVCAVFGLTAMSREDGLVSILRGFRKKELHAFSKELNLKKYTIQWRWAFRYQWVISNK